MAVSVRTGWRSVVPSDAALTSELCPDHLVCEIGILVACMLAMARRRSVESVYFSVYTTEDRIWTACAHESASDQRAKVE